MQTFYSKCISITCRIALKNQDIKSNKSESNPLIIWMNKENITHIWGRGAGDYSSFPKYEILTFVTTQINLENVILCETSQTQKDKKSHVFMWDLKMLNWQAESRMVFFMDWGRCWKIVKCWSKGINFTSEKGLSCGILFKVVTVIIDN